MCEWDLHWSGQRTGPRRHPPRQCPFATESESPSGTGLRLVQRSRVRAHGTVHKWVYKLHLLCRIQWIYSYIIIFIFPEWIVTRANGWLLIHFNSFPGCKRLFHSDCSAGCVPCSPVKGPISHLNSTSTPLSDRASAQRHSSPLQTPASTPPAAGGPLLRDVRGPSRDRTLSVVAHKRLVCLLYL